MHEVLGLMHEVLGLMHEVLSFVHPVLGLSGESQNRMSLPKRATHPFAQGVWGRRFVPQWGVWGANAPHFRVLSTTYAFPQLSAFPCQNSLTCL